MHYHTDRQHIENQNHMNIEQLSAIFADNKTTKKVLVESFNQYQAHIEIETPTATQLAEEMKAEQAQVDIDKKHFSHIEKEILKDDILEKFVTLGWKQVDESMTRLCEITGYDPKEIAMLLPNGNYLGNIANFARKVAVKLFERCQLIIDKEIEGNAKKIAQNRNLFARGFLMLHSSNAKVLTAIKEAHRQAGGESTGCKILANGDLDLRQSLLPKG
jgi:hypothetical protein